MSEPRFARELEVARGVAMEAATLVLGYFRQVGMAVERKDDNEPVTEADRAASALIVARLHTAFPGDGMLSEELPDDGSRLRLDRVWMVDPIDGTKDFIRGETGFAVMIGLCVEGRPRVGVVAQAATGRVYAATADRSTARDIGSRLAWVEDEHGHRTPLRTSHIAGPPGIRLVASKSHRDAYVDAVRKALAIDDEMNVGGVGLKVGLVAEGARDLYVYPGDRTKIWDSCAPDAILHAAGGLFTDAHGHALDYVGPTLANTRGLLATNGPLHPTVLAALGRSPEPG